MNLFPSNLLASQNGAQYLFITMQYLIPNKIKFINSVTWSEVTRNAKQQKATHSWKKKNSVDQNWLRTGIDIIISRQEHENNYYYCILLVQKLSRNIGKFLNMYIIFSDVTTIMCKMENTLDRTIRHGGKRYY